MKYLDISLRNISWIIINNIGCMVELDCWMVEEGLNKSAGVNKNRASVAPKLC
jgi:hypothetical protein